MNGPDFNLKIKVRSGRLIRAMRAAGMETAADLSRASGVSYGVVIDLINMQKTPYSRRGSEIWRDNALQIAAAVNIMPEDLWPEHLREVRPRREGAELELSGPELAAIMAPGQGPEQIAMDKIDVAGMLDKIPERNAKAIRLSFGIGCPVHTLQEIGSLLGEVGAPRARQIIQRGLRLIKHPSRSAGYQGYLTDLSPLPAEDRPPSDYPKEPPEPKIKTKVPPQTAEERKTEDQRKFKEMQEHALPLLRKVDWDDPVVRFSEGEIIVLQEARLATVTMHNQARYIELTDQGREMLGADA